MKALKKLLMPVLVSAAISGGTVATAFHEGGAAPCDACHTMHDGTAGGVSLLKARDQSSICLNCHERPGHSGPAGSQVSTPGAEMPPGFPPKQLTPGGDFGWLKKTYTWYADSGLVMLSSPGERHGHNIIAPDFGYAADITNAAAPGGFYPASDLTCVSCHDPHGGYRRNQDRSISAAGRPIRGSGSLAGSPSPDMHFSVGVYRMLGGKGYQPRSLSGNHGFTHNPPAAVSPDQYNRSEAAAQTRVAYGAGMSEWCRNCHLDMHTPLVPGRAGLVHPAGEAAQFSTQKADTYNSYVKTGDLSGMGSAAYLSLVPFEEGTADYDYLKTIARTDDSYLQGPDPAFSRVMCLTCHRAHASGWDGATRWNTKTAFLVSGGFYSQEGQTYQPYGQGRIELEALRAYYEIPASRYSENQDSLCNKCHGGVFP